MTYVLLVALIFLLIVFKKYSIDTGLTIAELKKDKDYFRNTLWNRLYFLNKESKVNDAQYQNVKKRIEILIKDIEETDFNNFDGDAKYELISALKEIEFYGDTKND